VIAARIDRGPDGILVVDKPAGMTSHDVVDFVRQRLETKKVGHGGTLDPGATGVLIVGIGRATRLLQYSLLAPKRYAAVARFGIVTSTLDAAGEVTATFPVTITRADVSQALRQFEGAIEQVPPMVSAVKVSGERLYKKAMRGEEAARPARWVTIHHLVLTGFDSSGDAVRATLDVTCSAGTYVRTLVNDLGAALGCGAHLESLRRVEAGGFSVDDAIPLDAVHRGSLRPVSDAVRQLNVVDVDGATAALVRNGRPVDDSRGGGEGEAVALMHEGDLLAVYRRRAGRLVADRVLPR
jgi:tRNA pseudouridine55 synthase